MLLNPGAGSIAGDVCRDHAIANTAAYIDELGMKDPPVAVTMRSPKHDGTGRYTFDLHRGIRTVPIEMPGLPLGEVRCTESFVPPGCPRLYVDGNSWWWCFALNITRDALMDHDGVREQRLTASEQASNIEFDRQPRCAACSNVRTLVTSGNLYEVRCYTCEPQIETRRETPGGAVYRDDSWRSVTHYFTKWQHMPPEAPGHENPMHPDALCGARLSNGRDSCRLKSRHEGRCEPYWREIERALVTPDQVHRAAYGSTSL